MHAVKQHGFQCATDKLLIIENHTSSNRIYNLHWMACHKSILFHAHIKNKLFKLWPSDIIWQQWSGSTLAQVMACCQCSKLRPVPRPEFSGGLATFWECSYHFMFKLALMQGIFWSCIDFSLNTACCQSALSHYLNQRWFLISKVLWNSHENNFTASAQATLLHNESENDTFNITATSLRGLWVKDIIYKQVMLLVQFVTLSDAKWLCPSLPFLILSMHTDNS